MRARAIVLVLGMAWASLALAFTQFSLECAASTNANLVASTAHTLYSMTVVNTTASPIFIKLYDKGTTPTVGTDIPVAVFNVPATSGAMAVPYIMIFNAGIGVATTGLITNADATAVTANACKVLMTYQ